MAIHMRRSPAHFGNQSMVTEYGFMLYVDTSKVCAYRVTHVKRPTYTQRDLRDWARVRRTPKMRQLRLTEFFSKRQ
jgi:hypothetical protein